MTTQSNPKSGTKHSEIKSLTCTWCLRPATRFGGSPYMADSHDMCIDCYQATYANHKDEILPFEMVERVAQS